MYEQKFSNFINFLNMSQAWLDQQNSMLFLVQSDFGAFVFIPVLLEHVFREPRTIRYLEVKVHVMCYECVLDEKSCALLLKKNCLKDCACVCFVRANVTWTPKKRFHVQNSQNVIILVKKETVRKQRQFSVLKSKKTCKPINQYNFDFFNY